MIAEDVERFIQNATTPHQRALRDEIERLRSEISNAANRIAELSARAEKAEAALAAYESQKP